MHFPFIYRAGLHHYQEKGGGHALSDLTLLCARACCNYMFWSDFRVHKEREFISPVKEQVVCEY